MTTALSAQASSSMPSANRGHWQWRFALCMIALLGTGVSAAMGWRHPPAPSLHDEFSNLLVADTLLHGRLANPSPTVWQPFQSFHVLVNPSYASKYPLGPGAMMALGWLLVGTTAAGIWLAAGACSAAIAWAAAGCLPRRWALIAGVLVAANANVHHQWSLVFMSGWMTATASALVAGAILRMRHRVRALDAIVFGIGVSGLALTRPFEGLLFTCTSAGLLLYWWRGKTWTSQWALWFRLAGWSAAPLTVMFCIVAMHNRATTGSMLQMAYQLHEKQYGVAPLNIFQSPRTPAMNDWSADVPPTVVAFHYGWSLESYFKRNHLAGWCGSVAERLHVVTRLWGWVFCLIGVTYLIVQRGPYWPMAVAILLALLAGSFVPWYFSHYFAPSLVWLVILTTLSLHWFSKRLLTDRRASRLAVGCLLAMQCITMASEVAAANMRPMTWAEQRQSLEQQLTASGARHLVLVRYHADHNVHHEWVFNGADLEGAAVVWARSWRPDLDALLLEQYRDRQIWILELDSNDHPRLSRFIEPQSNSVPFPSTAD